MTSQAIGELATGDVSIGMEQRGSRRVLCDGFAELFVCEAGFLFRGQIRDISQTGCYIMTKVQLKLERLDEVEVLFQVKNHEYCILARVMDVRPGKGVGLEFLPPDLRVEDSIQELLQTLVEETSRKLASKAATQPSSASPVENPPPSVRVGNLEAPVLDRQAIDSDMPPNTTDFITRTR